MNKKILDIDFDEMRTFAAYRWWESLLFKLLGRFFCGTDGNVSIEGYEWRGKRYVTKIDSPEGEKK
jgi:hypothetical protein